MVVCCRGDIIFANCFHAARGGQITSAEEHTHQALEPIKTGNKYYFTLFLLDRLTAETVHLKLMLQVNR